MTKLTSPYSRTVQQCTWGFITKRPAKTKIQKFKKDFYVTHFLFETAGNAVSFRT